MSDEQVVFDGIVDNSVKVAFASREKVNERFDATAERLLDCGLITEKDGAYVITRAARELSAVTKKDVDTLAEELDADVSPSFMYARMHHEIDGDVRTFEIVDAPDMMERGDDTILVSDEPFDILLTGDSHA